MGSVPPTIPASTGAPPRRTADPHCARSRLAVAAAGLMMAACPGAGLAWGDEGHEIIARIADHYLEPPVRAKVAALLAADTTSLTRDTGMAAEAAWAAVLPPSSFATPAARPHAAINKKRLLQI